MGHPLAVDDHGDPVGAILERHRLVRFERAQRTAGVGDDRPRLVHGSSDERVEIKFLNVTHRSSIRRPDSYRGAVALTPGQLTADALQFLRDRHLATFTSLRPDGTPHVTPVGFTWDEDRALAWIICSATSRKARNIVNGGPVVICQVDGRRWLSLEGTGRVTGEPGEVADAVARYARRYRQPRANPHRVAIEVGVSRVLGSAALCPLSSG